MTVPKLTNGYCFDFPLRTNKVLKYEEIVLTIEKNFLEKFIKENFSFILQTCLSKTRDWDKAKDLSQEVVINMLKYETFFGERDLNKFKHFVRICARNLFLNSFNTKEAKLSFLSIEREFKTYLDGGEEIKDSLILNLKDPSSPEEDIYKKEFINNIKEKLLTKYSSKDVEMFFSSSLDGLIYEELSVLYNIPLSSVRGRIYRMREFLRKSFKLK